MSHPITIEGLTPAEYAALWGSETERGAMFYNYGSERQVKDADWLYQFQTAIMDQIRDVIRNPTKYDHEDELGLGVLLICVEYETMRLVTPAT